jgi:aryl-alcohol dehydrogenase-like predicted oxidoreductase
MKYRRLGKTNFEVSEVSLGAWRIGGSWGSVSEQDAKRLLHAAIDQGINFIDTADVYGDGRSECLIAEVLTERRDQVYIATKAGRRLQPHAAEGYTKENLDDHRNFNRNGEQLDRGETFSGVDLPVALEAVAKIHQLLPNGVSMANFALRWILQHEEVSCVIPGARNETQVIENVSAMDVSPLGESEMQALARIYDQMIRPLVHHRW